MTKTDTTNNAKRVKLSWTGEGMAYLAVGEVGPPIVMDGNAEKGPGPMDTLLLSLAGCMAVDVQDILNRSRVPLTALEVEVEGHRAPEPPRRYTRIRLLYTVAGPEEQHEPRLQRALSLSREKYCSVLHSLHPDIELDVDLRRS